MENNESKEFSGSLEECSRTSKAPENKSKKRLVLIFLSMIILSSCILISGRNKLTRLINKLFGPPTVELQEVYSGLPNDIVFDHTIFNELLRTHVDRQGWVDYTALKGDLGKLDIYIANVASAPFYKLGRDQKFALLLNAYNAFTLKLILDYYPIDSIKDIPKAKSWDDVRWTIGGNVWSLNQIEHQEIRPKFMEPRIHFALVCAAVGCPPLRNEAYDATRLDEQLNYQTQFVHEHKTWFALDTEKNSVGLTKLYSWYGSDFDQLKGSVINYAAEYSSELNKHLKSNQVPAIQWLDYDWGLNSSQNKVNR